MLLVMYFREHHILLVKVLVWVMLRYPFIWFDDVVSDYKQYQFFGPIVNHERLMVHWLVENVQDGQSFADVLEYQ